MRHADRQRGIALIIAMWGGAVLALVVMSVLQLMRADAGQARGSEDVATLNAIADAAVNMTILAMLGPPSTRPTVNTGPAAVSFGGVTVMVSIMDESGKIDLNMAGAPTLRQLLTVSGMEPNVAQCVAEQIVARRSPASGGGPYQSIAALQLIPGITPALLRRLEPTLTVYSQSPWLDPNYSSLQALEAFRAFDSGADAAWRRLVEERSGMREQARKPGVVLGHAFTITADTAAGGARVSRVAVIRLTGQTQTPLLVYRWH